MIACLWRWLTSWLLPPSWCSSIGTTAGPPLEWRDIAGSLAVPTHGGPFEITSTARLDPNVQSTPTAFDQLYPTDRSMPSLEDIRRRFGYGQRGS